MNATTYLDALETSVVFKTYAAVSWLAGALLVGWGPLVFPLDLAAYPHGAGVVVRVAGAALLAAGCMAWGAAPADSPSVRRQVLTSWAAGHTTALGVVYIQVHAIFGSSGLGPGLAVGWLVTWTVLFWYARWTVDGLPWRGPLPAHGKIFEPDHASVTALRSTYEQRIREAAAQEERNRLARDLHDSIKQQIFVIQTAAATAQARYHSDPTGAAQAVGQVRASAREAMIEMEVMLEQLKAAPLENAGLVEALKKQCEALRFRTGADVTFKVGDLAPNESLPPGAHDAVFRVAQEALANVARHARATHVRVSLEASPFFLHLRVDDDGAGFDLAAEGAGMGLGNMRARAEALGGALVVTTEPGKGTLIRLTVPRRPGEVPGLKEYRRPLLLWGGLLAFWIFQAGMAITLSWERFTLTYQVPLVIVHAWLFARAAASYIRARRAARGGRAREAGAP